MKARVSINQFSGTRSGVAICIKDDASGLSICEVEMDFEQFGRCVSGAGDKIAQVRQLIQPQNLINVGKTKEWQYVDIKLPDSITCISRYSQNKVDLLNKLIAETLVILNTNETNLWRLSDNGLQSQQNKAGTHKIKIYRYVEKGGSDAQETSI